MLEQGLRNFVIPVGWSVYDTIDVEADTLENALKWAQENINEIPLGLQPAYLEDSYYIDAEGAYALND